MRLAASEIQVLNSLAEIDRLIKASPEKKLSVESFVSREVVAARVAREHLQTLQEIDFVRVWVDLIRITLPGQIFLREQYPDFDINDYYKDISPIVIRSGDRAISNLGGLGSIIGVVRSSLGVEVFLNGVDEKINKICDSDEKADVLYSIEKTILERYSDFPDRYEVHGRLPAYGALFSLRARREHNLDSYFDKKKLIKTLALVGDNNHALQILSREIHVFNAYIPITHRGACSEKQKEFIAFVEFEQRRRKELRESELASRPNITIVGKQYNKHVTKIDQKKQRVGRQNNAARDVNISRAGNINTTAELTLHLSELYKVLVGVQEARQEELAEAIEVLVLASEEKIIRRGRIVGAVEFLSEFPAIRERLSSLASNAGEGVLNTSVIASIKCALDIS